jgi:hypothetical protein
MLGALLHVKHIGPEAEAPRLNQQKALGSIEVLIEALGRHFANLPKVLMR